MTFFQSKWTLNVYVVVDRIFKIEDKCQKPTCFLTQFASTKCSSRFGWGLEHVWETLHSVCRKYEKVPVIRLSKLVVQLSFIHCCNNFVFTIEVFCHLNYQRVHVVNCKLWNLSSPGKATLEWRKRTSLWNLLPSRRCTDNCKVSFIQDVKGGKFRPTDVEQPIPMRWVLFLRIHCFSLSFLSLVLFVLWMFFLF